MVVLLFILIYFLLEILNKGYEFFLVIKRCMDVFWNFMGFLFLEYKKVVLLKVVLFNIVIFVLVVESE